MRALLSVLSLTAFTTPTQVIGRTAVTGPVFTVTTPSRHSVPASQGSAVDTVHQDKPPHDSLYCDTLSTIMVYGEFVTDTSILVAHKEKKYPWIPVAGAAVSCGDPSKCGPVYTDSTGHFRLLVPKTDTTAAIEVYKKGVTESKSGLKWRVDGPWAAYYQIINRKKDFEANGSEGNRESMEAGQRYWMKQCHSYSDFTLLIEISKRDDNGKVIWPVR